MAQGMVTWNFAYKQFSELYNLVPFSSYVSCTKNVKYFKDITVDNSLKLEWPHKYLTSFKREKSLGKFVNLFVLGQHPVLTPGFALKRSCHKRLWDIMGWRRLNPGQPGVRKVLYYWLYYHSSPVGNHLRKKKKEKITDFIFLHRNLPKGR